MDRIGGNRIQALTSETWQTVLLRGQRANLNSQADCEPLDDKTSSGADCRTNHGSISSQAAEFESSRVHRNK